MLLALYLHSILTDYGLHYVQEFTEKLHLSRSWCAKLVTYTGLFGLLKAQMLLQNSDYVTVKVKELS